MFLRVLEIGAAGEMCSVKGSAPCVVTPPGENLALVLLWWKENRDDLTACRMMQSLDPPEE